MKADKDFRYVRRTWMGRHPGTGRRMAKITSGPIRLSFESKEQVVVVPENKDLFVITENAAAQACQQAQNGTQFGEQFSEFLGFIHSWCMKHSDRVRACYVTVGDIGLNVLLCQHAEDFDFDFDDEVAELDLALFNQFPLVRAEVLQIPNQCGTTSELSPETPDEVLVVYGDGSRPSSSG